jgi:hypothetical protein
VVVEGYPNPGDAAAAAAAVAARQEACRASRYALALFVTPSWGTRELRKERAPPGPRTRVCTDPVSSPLRTTPHRL